MDGQSQIASVDYPLSSDSHPSRCERTLTRSTPRVQWPRSRSQAPLVRTLPHQNRAFRGRSVHRVPVVKQPRGRARYMKRDEKKAVEGRHLSVPEEGGGSGVCPGHPRGSDESLPKSADKITTFSHSTRRKDLDATNDGSLERESESEW